MVFHSYLLLIFFLCTYFDFGYGQTFDFPEGAPCMSNEGKEYNGTCVVMDRCKDSFRLLKIGQQPKICSFKGKTPVVCCSDCELIDDPNNVVFDRMGLLYYKTGQKSYDKCLDYFSKLPYPCDQNYGFLRVWNSDRKCHNYDTVPYTAGVGGRNARRFQFPHMALLGYGNKLESMQWLCGGSVISEKYILTAGHCISNSLGPVAYVALGILKRTDPQDLWQKYRVKRIIPHPQYKSPSKYHDIALLETVDRIKFDISVLPACLNSGDEYDNGAFVTGWGALGHRQQLADTLQTVFMKKFEKEECEKQHPPYRLLLDGYDHATQMCYGGFNEVKDSCEGDSGGPLQVTWYLSPCIYKIIGVTSYGRSCGFVGSAGIYTRVLHYLPWIESIVWP